MAFARHDHEGDSVLKPTVISSQPGADARAALAAAVQAARPEILELSHKIHAAPEPAFEERQAAAWVAAAIERHGYTVEHPAGRLETAVRGALRGGRGGDGPRIGIVAEYDALPGLGHGCGHNTMAASSVGAAIALATIAPELTGEIVFLGTPAEERGSGKQYMLDDGLFEGLDAALMYHPSDHTQVHVELLASEDIEVTFRGLQAHAATDPWMGKNALDALVLLFSSIGLWRQQLRPEARVHGIVLEGGTAANVIPSLTRGLFMIRSADQAYFAELHERFQELVRAAAIATGCESEVAFDGYTATMKHSHTIGERFARHLAALGIENDVPGPMQLGSSDMGNVSQVIPAIHPSLAICEPGTLAHTPEFRDAAISRRADEVTLAAATVIAQTAYDLFAEPDLVARAWREFRGE